MKLGGKKAVWGLTQ